ncbi:hypothetical protein SALBM135S_07973 [Streptomyces alboniger]
MTTPPWTRSGRSPSGSAPSTPPSSSPGTRASQLFGGEPIVLDSAGAAEAARLLGARRVVPVHFDSWAHFTEGADALKAAFGAAGLAEVLELD